MEEKYWKQFLETGKVTDYLYYKGMQICARMIDSCEGDEKRESDYSDRYGTCGGAYRGI